jgi:tetratricopeptide (TPR) repeat protein
MNARILTFLLATFASCATSGVDELAYEKYVEANRYFEGGRYAEAIPLYEFVIRHRDRILDAYRRLSYSHEMEDHPSEAMTALEKLLKVDQTDEYALRNLMRLYARLGLAPEGVKVGRRLAATEPADKAAVLAEVARLEAVTAARRTVPAGGNAR